MISAKRQSTPALVCGDADPATTATADGHRRTFPPPVDVTKCARSVLLRHNPCVVWFTGLSGAGKSTIANLVERQLHQWGCATYLLDGDNVRRGLNRDLGFADADRVENIRRVSEVARLMVDAGLIVLVAFISPFRADRDRARLLVEADEFVEVFVDVPLAIAEQRDPKGLYRAARNGKLKHFTGIDSPYEVPERPEIRVETSTLTAGEAARTVLEELTPRIWPLAARRTRPAADRQA